MGRRSEPKLTSRERLNRGLHYTAVGPVDITRGGVVGITAHSAESAAGAIKRRARDAREMREELTKEAEAVKQVVAELPQLLEEARKVAAPPASAAVRLRLPRTGRRGWGRSRS